VKLEIDTDKDDLDEVYKMLMAPMIVAKLESFSEMLRGIDKHAEKFDETTFHRIYSSFWQEFGDYIE
jgi:cyclophilin family peptidyl-prolyl cis-trans isomerase